LRARLKDVLPSNQAECGILLEILACCGVLEATFANGPGLGVNHDWVFVADWRGEDRYNKNRLAEIFGYCC